MSRQPCLFARTSRAGRHHQVDLVPPGKVVPPDFDRCVRLAEAGEEGKDYLAACKEVLQDNARRGTEVLVLYGVDVRGLERQKRHEAVRHELHRLREDLERLVTQKIDWSTQGPAAVERPELDRWLERLTRAAGGALPAAGRGWRPAWLALAVVVALVVCVGVLVMLLPASPDRPRLSLRGFWSGSSAPTDKGKEKKVTVGDPSREAEKSAREQEEKELGVIAERWGGGFSPDQVRTVLEAASARTRAATGREVTVAAMRGHLAKQWLRGKPEYVVPGLDEKDRDAVVVLLGPTPTRSQVIEARKKLEALAGRMPAVVRISKAFATTRLELPTSPTNKPRGEQLVGLLHQLQREDFAAALASVEPAADRPGAFANAPLIDGRHARLARLVVQLRDTSLPALTQTIRSGVTGGEAVREACDAVYDVNKDQQKKWLAELRRDLGDLVDALLREFPRP